MSRNTKKFEIKVGSVRDPGRTHTKLQQVQNTITNLWE
jgi:hypothetical protein